MTIHAYKWLLVLTMLSVPLAAQDFRKSKMYVEQDHKLRLRPVELVIGSDSIVTIGKGGKYSERVEIPYSDITELEYEKSKHRRWKTGILLSPIALLSKGKKHWLAVIRGEEETVFQLDKSNFNKILAAVEEQSGKKVKMIASRG